MSYGNIMRVEVNRSGVSTSHTRAQEDAGSMEQYRSQINKVAREHGVDPALIAGIISRESSGGVTLKNGWGDHGNAWGLMQVDKRWHTPTGAWDSDEHLSQATEILTDSIKTMQRKFSGLSREQQLKAGIAAYNCGSGNVHSYDRVDENTHHGNYSNDVVARAQWFKRNRNF